MFRHIVWYSSDFHPIKALHVSVCRRVIHLSYELLQNALVTSCVRLSSNVCVGIPYSMIYLSIEKDSLCHAVVLYVFIALISCKWWSGMSGTSWLPFIVVWGGPKMFTATISKAPLTINNYSSRWHVLLGLFGAHAEPTLTVIYISLPMGKQYYSLHTLSYIHHSSKRLAHRA